ncbi:MAG: hypothetical protein EAX91_07445 [Candidatus Lokiarchaeota archaeon]|nr:hypothetical protein [Candidatus Lokiarchaeota archaeon]
MAILSEREIENLKLIHPKKRILRYIFLSIGLLIIFLGCLFTFIGFDFEITLNGFNLSLIIDVIIIIFGGIITSKFFIASYYLRENSLTIKKMRDLREPVDYHINFSSLALSRLIAAILLITNGIISYVIFGDDVGHEIKLGSAIFLGGPSWFYVTGLPMLITGFSLLIYFFLSQFGGIFSKSKNFLFFYELRPGFPWLTEIPKRDIEVVRYQNNHIGPKLIWIILFIPFIVLQFTTAIPLFNAERAGPDFVLSWTFLILSILDISALGILILFPQNYFEIATTDKLYEMWLSPIKFRQSQFKEDFSEFLECSPNLRDIEVGTDNNLFSEVSSSNFQLFNLVFGLLLIIIAILMLTQMILFGPLVWWVALMYGIMLLVKSLFYDFSKKGGDTLQYSKALKKFRFRRIFSNKFHYVGANNVDSIKVTKWFRKLDFFDIFGISGLLVFLTVQQLEGWLIADTINLLLDNLISTALWISIIVIISLFLCLPIDVIEVKTQTITYRIPITLKLNEKNLVSKYYRSLIKFPKDALHADLKKTFLIRMTAIILLIFGAMLYVAIYFVFTF